MTLRILKCVFILFLCAFMPEANAQQPSKTSSAGFECDVFLDIHNGFYDWSIGKTYTGGQKLSSGNKYDKGAVTVANLNDTDGDGITDNIDPIVESSSVGRNEVDMIKLVIRKKITDPVGPVTLKKVGGTVTLWEDPKKNGSQISLNANNEITYSDASLPKTIFIEATAVSGDLMDIKFHLLYNGEVVDKVSATAVWVDTGGTWSSETITPVPNMPAPDGLPNLTHSPLVNNINNKWISFNGDRYGFQDFYSGAIPNNDPSNLDKRLGGRILFEFQVSPAGAQSLVKFDVTRQKKVRAYKLNILDNSLFLFDSFDFPYELEEDNEKPNDDSNNYSDEDNSPSNNLIYSGDIPSTQLAEIDAVAFKVNKISFHEFVRVGITAPSIIDYNESLHGSRGSAVVDWNCVYYAKRGTDNGKLTQDNSIVSNSEPLRLDINDGDMVGNGSISITTSNFANTEGYSLTYDGLTNRFFLQTSTGVGAFYNPNANETTWNISTISLNITINQGTTPFADEDTFIFSTFKTGSSKMNQVGLGSVNVLTNP